MHAYVKSIQFIQQPAANSNAFLDLSFSFSLHPRWSFQCKNSSNVFQRNQLWCLSCRCNWRLEVARCHAISLWNEITVSFSHVSLKFVVAKELIVVFPSLSGPLGRRGAWRDPVGPGRPPRSWARASSPDFVIDCLKKVVIIVCLYGFIVGTFSASSSAT